MNYTELIDRFWRLDEERPFTTTETRMYMKLLDMFRRVGFDHSVSMCNALAVGLFGISLRSYRSALQGLVDRGLIAVEYRKVLRRRCAVFTLAAKPAPAPAAEPDETAAETEREEPAAQSRQQVPQRIRIIKRQLRRKPQRVKRRMYGANRYSHHSGDLRLMALRHVR